MGAVRDFKSWTNKQAAPATIAIMALMIVSSIYWWSVHQRGADALMFTDRWPSNPWQLVTYSFAYDPLSNSLSLICFSILLIWMFFAGSSVEREIGPARFVGLWLITSAAPALLIGIYAYLANLKFGFGGPFLAVDGVTIVWCARNATATVMLYGILPVAGKWLAWIAAGTVFFLYGAGNPMFGLLATIPLILPWLYATNRIPNLAYGSDGGKTPKQNLKRHERMDNKYFDDVRKREQDRAEREKLRKLFESSMNDEHKDK